MRKWLTPMAVAVIGLTGATGCATAPDTAEGRASLDRDINGALARAYARDPSLESFLQKAHGYAILPGVAKGAFGVGGAYGKGIVFERGTKIGYCDLSQATIGPSLGGQTYTEIIVFENKAALEDFKAGNVRFAGQATAVGLRAGSGANAQYRNGVHVLTLDEQGLMLEASIGGQTFTFQPL
jgi:lipid-binding SYLF domain-containing protein